MPRHCHTPKREHNFIAFLHSADAHQTNLLFWHIIRFCVWCLSLPMAPASLSPFCLRFSLCYSMNACQKLRLVFVLVCFYLDCLSRSFPSPYEQINVRWVDSYLLTRRWWRWQWLPAAVWHIYILFGVSTGGPHVSSGCMCDGWKNKEPKNTSRMPIRMIWHIAKHLVGELCQCNRWLDSKILFFEILL